MSARIAALLGALMSGLVGALTSGLVGGILLSGTAHAQFSALDRPTRGSLIGGRVDYAAPDGGTALRGEIYGQGTVRGVGVYGHLPVAHFAPDNGDGQSAIGNLELGIFGTTRALGANVVVRGGLALGTSDADAESAIALGANQWPRITDRANHLPDTTTARISASPRFGGRRFFAQADLGVDLTFPPDDQPSAMLLRANVAVGAYAGPVRLTGEFVNISRVDGLEKVDGDAFFNVFVASIRHGMLYAALTVPLDDDVDFLAVGAGLEWRLSTPRRTRRRRRRRRR